MPLTAFGLNCTLKRGAEPSSTQKLLDQVLQALGGYGVGSSSERAVNCNILPGVRTDEGEDDDWPRLRRRIQEADILVLATPIWLGQPCSVCKRVLERLDAVFGEIDGHGRYPTFGRVALVAVVGNEDGAHHVTAELYQALADVGFTIPAAGSSYWVGEAMQKTNYIDLDETPEALAGAIRTQACNAAHLAELLRAKPYPGTR
ncbi:NAD(P)H-dependent oxidoreductase [Fulvimonas sp. R45]|jgi:multimeric flavodoxin WrbA|uniref:flavodoxin family protein n=1 Tax=Fulvimonas sp. R45 TaxID=3045937 RepID=UPI0026605824|nr:NAD(P)H-dependent oxidoreductase [Fulvimonas sp. R45]MDO1528201.1 NAD(P)H-dependent oxidoreductase [Fulvimonas sp. R45]